MRQSQHHRKESRGSRKRQEMQVAYDMLFFLQAAVDPGRHRYAHPRHSEVQAVRQAAQAGRKWRSAGRQRAGVPVHSIRTSEYRKLAVRCGIYSSPSVLSSACRQSSQFVNRKRGI